MIPAWVVVAGPDEGLVVEGEARHAQLEGRGLVLLPVDAAAVGASGAVGSTAYQRRSYPLGARFDGDIYTRACPLPVFLPLGAVRVAWAASVEFGSDARGLVRLAADTVPSGTSADVRLDPEAMRRDGVFRGTAVVRSVPNAWAVLCLAGAASGVAVRWFALTVLPL